MAATSTTQRRRANRKPVGSFVVRVEMKDKLGSLNWVTADVVDIIDNGFGVTLMTPLKCGSTMVVRGNSAEHRTADQLKAGVRWCVRKPDGTFRAGLEFLDSRSTFALDCYEVMQLSPNADIETISRVYRMLAARYHPDNTETGDSEKFIRLAEAYQILSDPEKRARYNMVHRETLRLRGKIFDQTSASRGKEEKQPKRFDGVKQGLNVPHGGGRQRNHVPPSVGALHGWSAALRPHQLAGVP